MSTSSIEWTEQTWNPIVGCSIKSTGCIRCYAMKEAYRFGFNPKLERYHGLTKLVNGKAVWTGLLRRAPIETLLAPLRRRKPTTYFVNSMGDLFHEDCPDEWIDPVFAVMALCPQHTFQVLTKRSDRMRAYLADPENRLFDRIADRGARMMEDGDNVHDMLLGISWPLPNVWLGVSTERQQEADERIPDLLATPAAVRFISVEPLLGPIDLHEVIPDPLIYNALHGMERLLDWVIVGGESGKDARPMHPAWPRSLRDQCAAAGVPFFFKQWGGWVPVCALDDEATNSLYHPAPARIPEAIRRCKVDQLVMHADGSQYRDRAMSELGAYAAGTGAMLMFQAGKTKSGRLLDGKIYDQMPERRP